jgi:hypothetical protein
VSENGSAKLHAKSVDFTRLTVWQYTGRKGFLFWTIVAMTGFRTLMPRTRLCRAEREQLPKSQRIPITCAVNRGACIRHNPGGICYPKCGKQTPFIPSEIRKNLIGELLPDLYSLSMAPDYAAQKRAKSQRYHRIAAVTQDNQRRGINVFMSDAA